MRLLFTQLTDRPLRFSALLRGTDGLSQRMLTRTLRLLELAFDNRAAVQAARDAWEKTDDSEHPVVVVVESRRDARATVGAGPDAVPGHGMPSPSAR